MVTDKTTGRTVQLASLIMHLSLGFRPRRGMRFQYQDGDRFNLTLDNILVIQPKGRILSRFPGVWQLEDTGEWEARVSIDGTSQRIGLYATEEDAAISYRDAVKGFPRIQHEIWKELDVVDSRQTKIDSFLK